jgi:hypothetical protein
MRTYREHIRSFVSRINLHSLIIHPAKAGIISHKLYFPDISMHTIKPDLRRPMHSN